MPTNQQLKDWKPTFGRLLREDDIERTRNILLGVLVGAGLLLVCYIALLMINAIDNAHLSYITHQMLIQSELNYKTN